MAGYIKTVKCKECGHAKVWHGFISENCMQCDCKGFVEDVVAVRTKSWSDILTDYQIRYASLVLKTAEKTGEISLEHVLFSDLNKDVHANEIYAEGMRIQLRENQLLRSKFGTHKCWETK